MTNIVINTNQLSYISGKYLGGCLFYYGVKERLHIHLQDELSNRQLAQNTIINLKGYFKEDVRPYQINLNNTAIASLPQNTFWESFLLNYFLSFRVTVRVDEYTDGLSISTYMEHHYIWCNLSKDRKTINKIEFGRYLPLEGEDKRKQSSWVKGVFTNTNGHHIDFLQSSFDGEASEKYMLNYSIENERKLEKFLRIPFFEGWTECDYRIGENGFYKSSGCTNAKEKDKEFQFVLSSVAEQDIPFLTDRLFQKLRLVWADSFLNNYRRHVDKTEVEPISNYTNSCALPARE